MHFNDELIAEVLADLNDRGLTDKTVIVISSDHGEEFDENGMGHQGHGSGYSRHQLQVPLIISWPGRARANRRTPNVALRRRADAYAPLVWLHQSGIRFQFRVGPFRWQRV